MTKTEDTSTRRNIIQMIKTQGPLSATEITNQLQITNMAVRRHLSTLEKDGLIETDRIVYKAVGRPTAVYRLTDAADELFPKKYHSLTLDLLHELVLEAGPEMVDVLFKRRKETLQGKYTEQIEGMLEEKVAALTDIQNENGYMAKWEKLDSGNDEEEYVITEHNCPISHIANQYEHACRCELELFESLLGADVKRISCLAKGDRNCTYNIKPSLKDRSTT